MRLENWAKIANPESPFQAPEMWIPQLTGDVYGHPRFEDGTGVTTSRIMGKRDGKVITYSGLEYELGEVDAEYEKLYPDAFNRLMNTLDELDAETEVQ